MNDGTYTLYKGAESYDIVSFILPPALLNALSPADEVYLQLTSKNSFCLTVNGHVYEGTTMDENPDLIDCFREESDGKSFSELGQVLSVMQVMRSKAHQADLSDVAAIGSTSSSAKKCSKISSTTPSTTIISDDDDDDDDEMTSRTKKGKTHANSRGVTESTYRKATNATFNKNVIHQEERVNSAISSKEHTIKHTQISSKNTHVTDAIGSREKQHSHSDGQNNAKTSISKPSLLSASQQLQQPQQILETDAGFTKRNENGTNGNEVYNKNGRAITRVAHNRKEGKDRENSSVLTKKSPPTTVVQTSRDERSKFSNSKKASSIEKSDVVRNEPSSLSILCNKKDSRRQKRESMIEHAQIHQTTNLTAHNLPETERFHEMKRKRSDETTSCSLQVHSSRNAKSRATGKENKAHKPQSSSADSEQGTNEDSRPLFDALQNNWYGYCPQLPEEPWKNCFATDIKFNDLESFSKASIARWVRKAFRLYNWLHDTIIRERDAIQRALSEGNVASMDNEVLIKGETLVEFANLYEELHRKLLHCRAVDPFYVNTEIDGMDEN